MSFKGWKCAKLGDIVEISSSKRIFAKEYTQKGIPFYRGKEVIEKSQGNKISNELFISVDRYTEIKEKFGVPKQGDILLTSVGTLGVPYLVQEEEFYFKDGNLTWFKNFSSQCDNKFIYLWLQSSFCRNQIYAKAIGSTQKALTIETLKNFELLLPPLEEQKAIADILSSLDEKIELNNQMNETLEEIAQALFKRWFVDFEFPNEEGQPYKSSGGEMVESELGMIPKAWKCVTLDDIISTISIKHNFNKEELIFLNTSDVLNGEVLHSNYTSVKGLPGQAKKSIQKDDILYSEIRPQNKRFAYVDFDASDYVVSTKLMVLRSKGVLHPKLIYLFLTNNKVIENLQMIAESRSGTFPQITFKELSNMKINVPLIENLNVFENSLVPLINKIFENKKENKRLIELRDTLLPKLISGEIRVSDFEE